MNFTLFDAIIILLLFYLTVDPIEPGAVVKIVTVNRDNQIIGDVSILYISFNNYQ